MKQDKLDHNGNRGSKLTGQTIHALNYDFSFKIPLYWVNWHNENKEKPNLHLTPNELSRIKNAEGAWDKDFSLIVNSIFDFDDCIAHVGREGWGVNSNSYGDLQVRVYMLQMAEKKIQESIISKGTLATKEILQKSITPIVNEKNNWDGVVYNYLQMYEDYGATASIDIRFKSFGDQTVVFSFMYTDQKDVGDEIAQILKSVEFK